MNQEQKAYAWQLYHLLQEASDVLWQCFEQPFVDDCIAEMAEEELEKAMSQCQSPEDDFNDDDIPF